MALRDFHLSALSAPRATSTNSESFQPKVAEAGWWPFSGCGWFLASPRACLEDIVKDAKDAAHFTAHVAGMIHTRSAKAWAQQSASRSAEALDQAQTALKEVERIEAWQNSLGPCALPLSLCIPWHSHSHHQRRKAGHQDFL
mmetsp:Transcript_59063/g.129511  ORF Transcript_59063/g.129511 Transcript_59063/m.129511 type:complete len:142 (+) Transcript_59063:34-459(+)